MHQILSIYNKKHIYIYSDPVHIHVWSKVKQSEARHINCIVTEPSFFEQILCMHLDFECPIESLCHSVAQSEKLAGTSTLNASVPQKHTVT